MRILTFSDLHLGAGYAARLDPLADAAAILEQIAALALERDVALVLNAGDTFHRAKPGPAELHCFKRFREALAALEIPMVCLGGNGLHEAAPGQRSALELFEGRWVRTSRRPEVITEFAGAAVCTLPAATVGQLVARRNGGRREAAYAEAVELLVRVAADLFAEAPDDRPRILLAHQMVSGASLPAGLPVEQVGSIVLPLEALEAIGYDAIVLGDIHKAQALYSDESPVPAHTWYCGSPMCHDFGEAEVDHGVWLIEFEWVGVGYKYGPPEFVPLQDRRFVTVDIDLTGRVSEPGSPSKAEAQGPMESGSPMPDGIVEGSETGPGSLTSFKVETFESTDFHLEHEGSLWVSTTASSGSLDETDQIASAIAAHFPLTDAVVRVRVRAREDQWRRVDQPALERLIADAGARLYGGIQADLQREQQARAAGLSEALGPAAALAMWCEAQEVPAEQAEALAGLLGEWTE